MRDPPADRQEVEGPDLAGVLRLLWERRGWLVLSTLGALAAAFVYLLFATPRYRAEALLTITPRAERTADLPTPPPILDHDGTTVDSLVQLLTATDLLSRASASAGLPAEAARDVEAVRRGTSRVIAVRATRSDPVEAARLADAVARLFVEDLLAAKRRAVRGSVAWLEGQLAETEAGLAEAERALADLRRRRTREPGALIAAAPAQLAELERRHLEATAERRALEARLAALRRGGGPAIPGPLVDRSSAYLDRLETLRAELVRQTAELADRYGARHPRMAELRRERAELDRRIAEARRGLLARFEAEVAEARVRERTLARQLADLRERIGERRRQEARERRLEGRLEELRATRADLARRLAAARAQAAMVVPDVELVQRALPPEQPIWPRPVPLLAFAGMAGLGLGLFAVVLRELLERGYRTPEALARDLAPLPVVALPRVPPAIARELTPEELVVEQPRSPLALACREILARLEIPAQGRGRVLLVTSSLPGEGRSTLAALLARIAAMEGLATVLIDADLAAPSLRRRFGLPAGPGLWEVARRGLDPLAALCDDPLTPLRVLPGGDRPRADGGLGTGVSLAAIFETLAARFRLVVVDGPARVAGETTAFAGLADAVVLTVAWRRTPREVVRATLAALAGVRERLALGVLQGGPAPEAVPRDVRRWRRARVGESARALTGA